MCFKCTISKVWNMERGSSCGSQKEIARTGCKFKKCGAIHPALKIQGCQVAREFFYVFSPLPICTDLIEHHFEIPPGVVVCSCSYQLTEHKIMCFRIYFFRAVLETAGNPLGKRLGASWNLYDNSNFSLPKTQDKSRGEAGGLFVPGREGGASHTVYYLDALRSIKFNCSISLILPNDAPFYSLFHSHPTGSST